MRNRTMSRILAVIICMTMVFNSQAVNVLASDIIETIEISEDEIINNDYPNIDYSFISEQDNNGVDDKNNNDSSSEITSTSEMTDIKESSNENTSESYVLDLKEESTDIDDADSIDTIEITNELCELIEINAEALSNINTSNNSDLSQESINILFRQHPEYLINNEYDSAIEDANDYAFQVQKTMTNQDMAVIMEAFNNGDKIVWDQIMDFLNLGEDYKTKQEKAMAWEVVEKYCSADTSLTTTVKAARDDLKGINKIYNQTGSALKEALKTDLKQQNLQISPNEIDVIVDKSFKQVSSLQQVANESMTALGVCMEYVELVLVEEKIYSDLISICQSSGCEILVEQLTKIKKDRDDNFESYFVNHYLNEAVFKNVYEGIKDWVIKNKNVNKAFNIKEINKLYSISKKVIEIVSEIYGSNNATVYDIVFSTMAENYYNAAHHEVHKYRRKFIENPSAITDEDIRMYEVAYKLELVSIQILSKYCWKIAYKVDKNSDLHMSMLMQKNEVDRLTYNKYLNSCLENLRKDNIAVPASEEEDEDDVLQSITARFSLVQMQFMPNVGQTWTATYGGCSQCFGFARLVFSMLFGCEMPSAYSSEKPYLYPNEINVVKVGQLVGSNVTSESVRNLLSQGRLGDIIQASGNVYGQHTMVFVGVGEGYVRVYDCNAAVNGGTAGSCTINEWNISFENFARWYGTGTSSGVTLYRASNYNEIYGEGDFAFYDDSVNFVIEDGVLVKYNGWQKNVVIPEGVITIGTRAFDSNRMMQTVYIPESVTSIGNYAFYRCTGLKNVRFPNSIKSIGQYAFNGCSSLEEIILPSKLETIVEGAFGGCSSARKIFIPKSLTAVNSFISGGKIDGLFEGCDNVTEIVFESGITSIPGRLFRSCEWLKTIDIPNTVTTIEGYAFSYCLNLESVMIPESVTSIGNYAFYYCESLEEINMPNTVTNIGEYVLYECSTLKTVHLPENRQIITSYMFYGCTSLEEINLPDTLKKIQQYAFYNCDSLKNIDLPDNIESIGNYAFNDCDSLESLTLGDKVSSIGTYSFYHCDRLKDVRLSNALKAIPSYAFSDCAQLEKMTMPYNITTISKNAFTNDAKLKEITIPRNTNTIDKDAFSYPLTIYGVAGTYAETYANKNGHKFVNREINATELKVLPESPTVNKYGQLQLVLNVTPADFTDAITCKSTDTDIITVDNTGLVKGIGIGSASVKITVGSISKTVDVRVKQPITSIYVYPNEKSLNAGETVELSASVYPYDAENQGYIWESEDNSIATVDENGVVTAISKGEVKINAKALDGSEVEGYCKITVLSNLHKVYSTDDFQSPHNYELNCSDIWEYTDEDAESLSITFSEDTEVEDKFDYIYIYDKDNKQIGKYTGKQLANKTITIKGGVVRVKLVSDDNGTAYGFRVVSIKKDAKNVPLKGIVLTKSSLLLCNGDTALVEVKYDPEDATVDEDIEWTSDDERIASVESGLIKAIGTGTTIITAKLQGKTASCKVTVTEKLSSIILNPSNVNLYCGQSVILRITTNTGFIPIDGTTIVNSDSSVASLDADLAEGTIRIKGLSEGNTIITVTTGDVEASAYITIASPKISFKDQDGSDISLQPIKAVYGERYPELPVPVSEGKVFIGWYTGANCSGALITSDTVFQGKDVLYAAWILDDAKLRIFMSNEYEYSGAKICPHAEVYDGKTRLAEKKDFTIAYKNNASVYILSEGDAGFNPKKAPSITIAGKGNYNSKEVIYFKILPADISGASFDADDMALVYSKKSQKVTPVLYWKGKALKNGKDYKFEIFRANDSNRENSLGASVKDPGDYVIRFTGINNFTGEREVDLKVSAELKPVSKLSIGKIANAKYTGSGIKPEPVIKDGKNLLEKDKHYTLTYKSNTAVGMGYVFVNGITSNGYAGTRRIAFNIIGTPIENAVISGLPKSVVYSGNEVTYSQDALKLYLKATRTTPQIDLVRGDDYVVSYSNNVNVGNAIIDITGVNGYTGVVKKAVKITPFDITPSKDTDGRFIINCAPTAVYSKGGAKPDISVTFKNADGTMQDLVIGKDYTVTYKNNTSVGGSRVPLVIVTGKGNFRGNRSCEFTITTKDISSVTLNAADKVYVNKANAYATSVSLIDTDGKALKAGTDYEKKLVYAYLNDTEVQVNGVAETKAAGTEVGTKDIIPAGTTIKVTATAKGNYTNEISGTYRITQTAIGSTKIGAIPAQIYTGKPITLDPEMPTITFKNTKLVPYNEITGEGDFIIKGYSNNTKVGTATFTLQGVGNYGGTKVIKFKIVPKGFRWWWR